MEYTPQLQDYLNEKAKEYTSTCSFPEAVYQIVFVEKLTPEKVRNEMIFAEYLHYIRGSEYQSGRYGKGYIYRKLAHKHNLSEAWVKEMIYDKIKNEG